MSRVGDLWPVWWDTGDGKPSGQHEALIMAIRPYDGPVEGVTHILRLACPGTVKGWTEMSVTLEPDDVFCRLGNCLRGHFEGHFPDIDTAWEMLSRRFLMSYPVEPNAEGTHGRHVQMYIHEQNVYGLAEWVLCRDQKTHNDCSFTDADVSAQCKRNG